MNIDIDNIAAHNDRVLSQSLRAISELNTRAIEKCAVRGLGERRQYRAIAETAVRMNADVEIVLAAFGFLICDGIPYDALAHNCGAFYMPGSGEMRAAWNLAQLAFGGPARSQVMKTVREQRAEKIARILRRKPTAMLDK